MELKNVNNTYNSQMQQKQQQVQNAVENKTSSSVFSNNETNSTKTPSQKELNEVNDILNSVQDEYENIGKNKTSSSGASGYKGGVAAGGNSSNAVNNDKRDANGATGASGGGSYSHTDNNVKSSSSGAAGGVRGGSDVSEVQTPTPERPKDEYAPADESDDFSKWHARKEKNNEIMKEMGIDVNNLKVVPNPENPDETILEGESINGPVKVTNNEYGFAMEFSGAENKRVSYHNFENGAYQTKLEKNETDHTESYLTNYNSETGNYDKKITELKEDGTVEIYKNNGDNTTDYNSCDIVHKDGTALKFEYNDEDGWVVTANLSISKTMGGASSTGGAGPIYDDENGNKYYYQENDGLYKMK